MIEKKWARVPPQLFTSNGDSEGNIQVPNTALFKVKQRVTIFSDNHAPLHLEVKRISSDVDMKLGPIGQPIHQGIDLTAFLVSDNSRIAADEQDRPAIPPDAYNRAVYDEEPTVALRNVLVDRNGNKYSTDNPFPVQLSNGSVNIGTVNAELEVQLTDKDNYPDPGDVHDSIRIGNGFNEADVTSQNELKTLDPQNLAEAVATHQTLQTEFDETQALIQSEFGETQTLLQTEFDETQDKLDTLTSTLQSESDETQLLLQTEFDETQSKLDTLTSTLQNESDQTQMILQTEFDDTQALIQAEFNETQVKQDSTNTKLDTLTSTLQTEFDDTQSLIQAEFNETQTKQDATNAKLDTLKTEADETQTILQTEFNSTQTLLQTEFNETQVKQDSTNTKLDTLTSTLQTESDQTQMILQTEFDDTQALLQNEFDQTQALLQTEFDDTQSLIQAEFNETQIKQDATNTKLDTLKTEADETQMILQTEFGATQALIQTEFNETQVKQDSTNTKLDTLTSTLQTESDQTQTILQTEFDDTQALIQAEFNETQVKQDTTNSKLDTLTSTLQTEFDDTQALLQAEFDQTQTLIQDLKTEVDSAQYTMNEAFNKAGGIAGQLDDVGTTVATENNMAPVRITPYRALHTNLRSSSGTEIESVNSELKVRDQIDNGGVQGAISVSTTAVAVRVGGSNLSNRKVLTAFNNGTATLYWGYTNAVTPSTGTPLMRNQFAIWEVGSATTIWIIASSGSHDLRVTEGA